MEAVLVGLLKHQRKLGPTAWILLAMVMLPYTLILEIMADFLPIFPWTSSDHFEWSGSVKCSQAIFSFHQR